MRTFVSGPVAVLILLLLTSHLVGQDRQRFGRRGGPPFGDTRFGRGGDPTIGLLMVDEVRTELGLSEEQTAALTKLVDQRRNRADGGERPNFRELSDAERDSLLEKFRQESAERAAKIKEQLEEVLLPGQMERLAQIALQARGTSALADPEIRDQLQISGEQVEKLDEFLGSVRDRMRNRMQELFQSGDRDKLREAFGQLRNELEQEALALLTDEQRDRFNALKGKPFDLPSGGFGNRERERGRGFPRGNRGNGDAQQDDSP